jgi:Na+/proline symporter
MGGWNEVSSQVLQVDQGFLNPVALSFGVFAGFLGIGLGSPGNPHILVRYMSIKDPSQFRWTAVVGTCMKGYCIKINPSPRNSSPC